MEKADKKKRRKESRFEADRTRTGILFLLPSGILCFLFIIIPLIVTFVLSFFEWSGIVGVAPKFCGFDNYAYMKNIQGIGEIVPATLIYVVGVTILTILVSLVVALMLDKREKGRINRNFMRTMWFFPCLLSPLVVGILWRIMLNYNSGLVNKVLTMIGLGKVNWIETRGLSNLVTIIATVWMSTGMTIVIFLAGLQSIPTELYEAAAIDGASPGQIRRNVTIPLLAPSITINVLTTSIAAFKMFELPWNITMGQPGYSSRLWTKTIYFYGFENIFNLGIGFAISVVLVLVIAAISLVQLVVLRKWEDIY